MKKRILSICIVLCLMLIMASVAFADSGIQIDEDTYETLEAAINAAQAGDTIYVPAGTYILPETRDGKLILNRPISFVGEPGTVFVGAVVYGQEGFTDDGVVNKTITWSNITLQAGDNNNLGLCLSGYQGSNAAGYTLDIDNCAFVGFQYGVAANSGANSNQLDITDTSFEDTWCALSVQIDSANPNTVTTNNVTIPEGSYAVQTYGDNDVNAYYEDVETYLRDVEDGNYDNADVNNISAPSGSWEAYTESDGIRTYDTLANLISAASDETTIYITSNITLTSGINVTGKKLNVVGNGHTISYERNGSFDGVFGNSINAATNGTVINVSNLTIKNTSDNAEGWASVVGTYNDGTTASVSYTACTFVNLGAGVYVNPFRDTAANVSITDCKYENTGSGIGIDGSGIAPNLTYENNTGVTQELVTAKVSGADKVFTSIQAAVNAADDNSTVTVGPGKYNENIVFNGKSLTIKAQYPAYNNGVEETDESKLSEFTGTFSTSGTSFNADQSITIDGFKLTGNGLKVGDINYNTVGNLTVQNCVMETGDNLDANTVGHNSLNYFVKVNGDENYGPASVAVHNNKLTGEAVSNVFPIQLWNVDDVQVTDNYIELTNAANHQAINISKLADDATVVISDNTIEGVGGGIYVTTWKVNGTDDGDNFVGSVTIDGNNITGAQDGQEIYIGYEDAANYGDFAGTLSASNNYNEDELIDVAIHQKPGSSVKLITVTLMNRDSVINTAYLPLDNAGTVEYTLGDKLSRPGYTFEGWRLDWRTYDAGDVVTLSEDTTFYAVWSKNSESIHSGSTYDINISDTDNGTVDTNLSRATEGKSITITAMPEDGYVVDSVKVTGPDGRVDITRVNATTYRFTMPDGEVDIEVSFVAESIGFHDVSRSDWYYDAVSYVYNNDLMTGVSNTQFAPNSNLTRGMLVTILYRLEDEPRVTGSSGFADVASDAWYADAVTWAADHNIVNGISTTKFAPNVDITREQLAAILYRYASYKGYDVTGRDFLTVYTDRDSISAYALDAMQWAVDEGIITGMTTTTIRPQGTATRAQCATMLMRFIENVAQ